MLKWRGDRAASDFYMATMRIRPPNYAAQTQGKEETLIPLK